MSDERLNADYVRLPGPIVWYGGKGQLRSKILPHIPESHTYVEPYGGAASLLFAKPPSPVEVYNDLHGDLVALFRVLRDPEQFETLRHRLTLTLKAKGEYEEAVRVLRSEDASEEDRAWAFFVAMNQGFGGCQPTPKMWATHAMRTRSGMAASVTSWWRRVAWLNDWHERLARVQIENSDALEVIRRFDSAGTVFYLDPPYVPDTRVRLSAYKHEQSLEHHEELVRVLLGISGQAVLSGYDHPVYQPLANAGWRIVDFTAAVGGAVSAASKKRTERLWILERTEGREAA